MVHRTIELPVTTRDALVIATRAIETSGLAITSLAQEPGAVVARIRFGWYALDGKVRITAEELSGRSTRIDIEVASNRTINVNDWGKTQQWADALLRRIQELSAQGQVPSY